MNGELDAERIARLTLRELTREGGEGLLLERVYIEVENTTWTDADKATVMNLADDVVHLYHAKDERDDNTYATHVLRVAARILSPDHFNYRDDPELVIAALLHDVIEDHPERLLGQEAIDESDIDGRLEQRRQALNVIKKRYGERVAGMVEGVSNPIYDQTGFETEERQEKYRGHIRGLMEHGGDERLIKLSDFIDNCLGLGYNPQESLRRKLAHKYFDLIPVMRAFVVSSQLSDRVQDDVLSKLDMAQSICEKIFVSELAPVKHMGGRAMSDFPTLTAHAS